jgi:tetratricopeptide (TPR) repeat protein
VIPPSHNSARRPRLAGLGLVLALGLASASARATTLLETTQGVIGRGIAGPKGPAADAAQQHVDAREWSDAARAWAEAAGAGADPAALLWEIACLVRADQDQAAQEATRGLLATGPHDAVILLMAAWVLNELGQPGQAAHLLDDFPSSHPDALGAAVLRMRAYTQDDALRKAARVRRTTLRRDDLDAWFWLEVGLEDAWANVPDAGLTLERATRTTGATAFHSVVRMRYLEGAGQREAAVDEGLRAMARFPSDNVLPHVLASLARYPEGEARLQAVMQAQPDHPAGNAVLGLILLGRDDRAAALHLERAIAHGEVEPELYLALGQALVAVGDEPLALVRLQSGAALHPEHPVLLTTALAMAHAAGDQVAQLGLLDTMATVGGARPETGRAALLVATNLNPSQVESEWTDALTATPDVLLAPGVLRELVQGEALASLGRAPEAELAFSRAVATRSSDVLSLAALLRFQLRNRPALPSDGGGGHGLVGLATSAAGDDAAALCLVAAALWEGGQEAQAIELLSRAVAFDPDDASARDRLGRWRSAFAAESP